MSAHASDPDSHLASNFLSIKSSDRSNDLVTQSISSTNSSNSSLSFYFGELGDRRDNEVVATSSPEFVYHNNASGTIVFGDSSFWNDTLMFCQSTFECVSDSATGWNDNSSFRVSTRNAGNNNGNNSWSWIYGGEISDIKVGGRYNLFISMKLNEYVVQSHIVLQGYNALSQTWYTITHCPIGTDGPLEWSMFSCQITIPEDTTKIRFILNAGWSSSPQHKAITWYDGIYMRTSPEGPFLYDGNLEMEVVNEDKLELPTTMTFLGRDDFLVLEKSTGQVQRIINGSKLEKPLLDLNVSDSNGALGIAAIKPKGPQELNNASNVDAYVFIYYDEIEVGDCICKPNASRLYRYELVNNGTELVNAKLFISLPIGGTYPILHEGGPVKIGPDGNVYLMVGDIRSVPEGGIVVKNKAVNYNDGNEPDGRAGILRFNIEGGPVKKEGILGDNYPLNLYYAYGIRNSFGFTFDPVTGNMWDSENGPDYGDEINLVEPGFNSGWAFEMGMGEPLSDDIFFSNNTLPENLVDFNGRGKYSFPEFVWHQTVGPTALTFLGSEQFGVLKNDLLAGDYLGNIYHFSLNENRTKLILDGGLDNSMPIILGYTELDNYEQASVFGGSFGIITDMQIGPDGNLYIVSSSLGKIFKVGPDI
jgi:aldose sugar dehydrogenase